MTTMSWTWWPQGDWFHRQGLD